MVTRLRPLEVTIVFEHRRYKLGGMIDIDLELHARRDVVVREGRVDLICQENYKQTFDVPVTKPGSGAGPGSPPVSVTATKPTTQNRSESYPHDSMTFVSDERLESGTSNKHEVRLEISHDLPQHMSDPTASGGEASWLLVATLDVARARDIAERCPIDVVLP